jgi:hypothetical protein
MDALESRIVNEYLNDFYQFIHRGVFQSVERLIEAIRAYIDEDNENPKPFVWTAKAEGILEKVRRARAVLDKIASE